MTLKVKSIAAICGLLGMIVTAVWIVEDRYVNEVEAADTLQQVQQSMQQMRKEMHQENLMVQYDFVQRQLHNVIAALRNDPNNIVLQNEYNRLLQRSNELGRALGIM